MTKLPVPFRSIAPRQPASAAFPASGFLAQAIRDLMLPMPALQPVRIAACKKGAAGRSAFRLDRRY